MCSPDPTTEHHWRVHSTYTVDVTFVWEVIGSWQSGSGVVPAMVNGVPGETFFVTSTSGESQTVVIRVNGVQEDVKANNPDQCPDAATATADFYATQTASASAPVNLISDSGFESGSICCGWSGSGTVAIVNTDVQGGSFAAQLGPNQSGMFQTITGLSPSTAYVLRGWVKNVNNTDQVYVGVKNFDGAADWNQFTTNTTYTELTIEFTTGAANTSAEIYCWKETDSADVAFCDTLSLVRR
jgi:hypothetical protein